MEQLGLAIILSAFVNSRALISGTINFLSACILHAEELSMTVVPTAANFGAHSSDVFPPAEKSAICGFIAIAVAIETILKVLLRNEISFPTERSDATGINSVTGKFLSSNTFNITCPTIPVAPTTATFIRIFYYPYYLG